MDTRIFHFTSELDEIRNGTLPDPIHAFLDITQYCNQRCWYCYDFLAPTLGIQRTKPDIQHMPLDKFKRIMELFAKLKIQAIDICGGEPLSHPSIMQIIEAIINKGFKFGLVTNGTYFREDLWNLIVQNGSWLRFSIDTTNPKLYKDTRKPDSKEFGIEQVKKNIEQAILMREKLMRSDLPIGANAVIDRRHVPYLFKTALDCKGIGLDYLRFSYVSAGEKTQQKLYPDHVLAEIQLEMEKIEDLVCETFQIIPPSMAGQLNPLKRKDKKIQQCYWSQFTLTVDVSGMVYTCPEMKFDKRFSIGSIFEMDSNRLLNSQKRCVFGNKLELCGNCCKMETNYEIEKYINQPKGLIPFI